MSTSASIRAPWQWFAGKLRVKLPRKLRSRAAGAKAPLTLPLVDYLGNRSRKRILDSGRALSVNARRTLALLTLLAVLPASASAEVRTASFDELGDNVPIAEQYAAQGIHFDQAAPFPINSKVCTRSFYALATGRAFNPPNVAHADRCGIEFGYSGVLVKVDRSRMVSAEAGLSVAAGSAGPVKLEAYNETGGLVGLAEGTAGPSASTTLRVERPGGDIYWAAFYSDKPNTPLELDFFQTDAVVNTEPPPPPPQPNFQIEADNPNSLGVAPGGTATTYLTIRRLGGSTGRIGFSAENLPRGVTASFLPDPATGGDRERVRVTFTAAADAPAVSDGIVFIRARPLDATAGADVRSATTFLSVAGRVDLRLRGIDVFQAVQGLGTLLPGPATNGGEYRGTRLGAGQKTVARVFADATGAAPPGVHASVVMRGYDAAGRERPDSPLFPIWAPNGIAQRETPGVFPDERADPAAAYTFVLPPTWTHGKLNLRAGISVPESPRFADQVPVVECARPDCAANNSFDLRDIEFERMHAYWIRPVGIVRDGGRPLAPPSRVFDATRAVTPGPLLIPNGYVATLDNTRIHCAVLGKSPDPKCESVRANNDPKDDDSELADWKNAATRNLVYDWSLNYQGPGDFNVGVNIGTARGQAGEIYAITNYDDGPGSASGDQRPLTSVAHEVFHLFGPKHASSCGKAKNGEPWPPDERGRLQSLGLDRRDGSGGPTNYAGSGVAPPPFRVFQDTSTTEFYDFMSYCAQPNEGDPDSWVSARNWEAVFEFLRVKPHQSPKTSAHAASRPRAVTAAAAPRTLEVTAYAAASGVKITGVRPPGPGSRAPAGGSAFSLAGRNAAGAVVATAPLEATGDSEAPITLLRGRLPARSITKVEIVAGATVRAARARSPNAPRARVRRPRIGKGRVTIRWTATDRDRNALGVSIDYSGDGGRSWRTVYAGPNKGRVQLPSRLLYASRRGRLRVRANDGFNETSARSTIFRARGAKPAMRITSPGTGLRARNDASLVLTGEAFDDALRRLRGRRLSWYSGKRRIARGEIASVAGLTAGRRRIRLVARDRSGRKASASVVVRLDQAQPTFLRLAGPKRIGRRTRRITLRVSSSVPATLSVAGRRFRVERRARRIRIRIKRGRGALRLQATLTTRGLRAARTLTIKRKLR